MSHVPTLHMFHGNIASGKSTLAKQLGGADGNILISGDEWLVALFSDQMASTGDYVRCTSKLRAVMGPHVSELLSTGVSVVLDFQANTVDTRSWKREILERTDAAHQLHVLDVPDAICLARLRERNALGCHSFAATEEQFLQISKHIVPLAPEEGFNIMKHKAT